MLDDVLPSQGGSGGWGSLQPSNDDEYSVVCGVYVQNEFFMYSPNKTVVIISMIKDSRNGEETTEGKQSKSDPTDDQDEGCCVFVVCCVTVCLSVCLSHVIV